MNYKDIGKYIDSVVSNIPDTIKVAQMEEKYGYEVYDVFYGLYQKHTNYKKFKNNVKRILCQKS